MLSCIICGMKRNVYIMYAIALLQGMVFYGPIATLYRQAQGVSVFEITLIESISLLLCIIFEVPWGVVADKIGYKKTMVFCSGLYFLSKVVFWQAESFGAFLLERIMLSVIIAGLSGVDTSILFISAKGQDSQKIFGVYNALSTAGLLGAALVFSAFVKDNYSLAAFLTVISYGVAAVLSLGLKEVRAEEAAAINLKHFAQVLKAELKDKKLLLFLFAVAFLRESHNIVTVFLNQLQYERCGLGNAAIGYIYVAVALLGLVEAKSQSFSKRLGIKNSGSLLLGLGAFACFALIFTNSAAISIASVMLLRLSHSLFNPLQTELQNRQVKTAFRATTLSIYAMITDGVSACANLAFGALADVELGMAFAFGTAICLAGLFMFMKWYKNNPQI